MAKKSGAQPNNQNGLKLKDSNVRQEAYRQYCEYISGGGTKEAWTFEHPDLTCTNKTMEKYMRENPLEFPPIQKEVADSKSYEHWCTLGKRMMLGQIEKCQPAIFQMFMRNKFDWDKDQTDEVAECAADKILEAINNRKK